MDYVQDTNMSGGIATPINVNKPERPLDRIGVAADRLGKLNYLLGEFHERFHGPQPASALIQTDAPRPTGYGANIASLFDELDRLEQGVAALGSIG